MSNDEPQQQQLSVSQRRALRRAEEAARKKAEKEAARAVAAASAPPKAPAAPKQQSQAEADEENLTEAGYRDQRIRSIQSLKAQNINPYPHKFHTTHSIPNFINQFQHFQPGQRDQTQSVAIAGRIMRIAGSGNKLRFYDLIADDHKVQVMADASVHQGDDYLTVHNRIRRGDIVGVIGFPGRSQRGEISIFPTSTQILTPCLQMLPKAQPGSKNGLKDQEIRYRQRYLDLLFNPQVKRTFQLRSKILAYIRKYLTAQDFVEVETPMMNAIPGGATARPFITHHNELNTDLYMRIAPELYLKMLTVGGMDRVFEIGKNFRNEGIDLTHNPEFTACEFYMAYADYNDMQRMTEEMISGLVKEVCGSYKLPYHPEGPEGPQLEIDFTPPWPRVSYVAEIEKQSGVTLPRPLDSPECIEAMKALCKREGLDWPKPPTAGKLLDKLCGHFVEDRIVNPTFISDHPQLLSPLAKWHRDDKDLAERCELFVMGKELANFYTELNDPMVQRQCFENQAKDKAAGDDEAQFFDEGYCTALEYGLPPTGGWGLGIDRLVMFLSDNINIKEVILFPAMRPLPAAPAAAPAAPAATSATANEAESADVSPTNKMAEEDEVTAN